MTSPGGHNVVVIVVSVVVSVVVSTVVAAMVSADASVVVAMDGAVVLVVIASHGPVGDAVVFLGWHSESSYSSAGSTTRLKFESNRCECSVGKDRRFSREMCSMNLMFDKISSS